MGATKEPERRRRRPSWRWRAVALAAPWVLLGNLGLMAQQPAARPATPASKGIPVSPGTPANSGGSLPWNAKRPAVEITTQTLRFREGPSRSTKLDGQTDPAPEPATSHERPAQVATATTSTDGLFWRSPIQPASAIELAEEAASVRPASYPSLQPPQGNLSANVGMETSGSPAGSSYPLPSETFSAPSRFAGGPRDSSYAAEPIPLPAGNPGGLGTSGSTGSGGELDELPPVPPQQNGFRYTNQLRNGGLAGAAAEGTRPCDPKFNNDRDCCEQIAVCRTARELVRAATLDRISIDITPRFSPDEDDPVEEQRQQTSQLGRSPARVWHDRNGRRLAEGRMVHFARGRVRIVDEQGRTTEIPYDELAEEELCFVTAWWSLPTECGLGSFADASRDWLPLTMTWKATAAHHKPLYFEEVQLERYGHTAGPIAQPIISTAHFFVNIAVMPYKAGIHPPHECSYALGYYRPGSCAPWLLPPVPLSLRGAAAELAAVGGLIAVLPK